MGLLVATVLVAVPAEAAGHVIHVDRWAGGADDGTSWTDAYTDLGAALASAGAGDDVWVAAWEYTPTSGADRTVTFTVPADVSVYGGFPQGGGDGTFGARDPATHLTSLTGNIGGSGPDDNSYHVVTLAAGGTLDRVIDGIAVHSGFADGAAVDSTGGGLLINGPVTLIDVTIHDNVAVSGAGAYVASGAEVVMRGGTVRGNGGSGDGTGFFFVGTANATFDDVLFANNNGQPTWHMNGTVRYVDSILRQNSGAVYSEGSLLIANSVFNGNNGEGALFAGGDATIVNSTIVDNLSSGPGQPAVRVCCGAVLALHNSIIWDNTSDPLSVEPSAGTPDVRYSNVKRSGPAWPGEGNVEVDPRFVDRLGPAGGPGDGDEDLRLASDSPLIDAGSNALVAADITDADADADTTEPAPFDLLGEARRLDLRVTPDTGSGTPPLVDLGAFEHVPPPNAPPVTLPDVAIGGTGGLVTVPVLANDSDPDDLPGTTTILQVSDPTFGSADRFGNEVAVKAPTDEGGIAQFTYVATDPTDASEDTPVLVAFGDHAAAGDLTSGEVLATRAPTDDVPFGASVTAAGDGLAGIAIFRAGDGGAVGWVVDLALPDTGDVHQVVFEFDADVFAFPPAADDLVVLRDGQPLPACGAGAADPCVVDVSAADATYAVTVSTSEGSRWSFASGRATIGRVFGNTRIETAVELSEQAFTSAPHVIIARSDDFPDALAGGPLGSVFNGPVLLTPPDALADVVADEIARLGPAMAILLGGEAALSADVATQVEALGVATRRIGGDDRFDTARLIAAEFGGAFTSAYVALGQHEDPVRAWPDALAVGGLAALQRRPLLLTRGAALPDATLQAIADNPQLTDVTLVGGPAAIAEDVRAELEASGLDVGRLSGLSRYGTSVAVADATAVELGAPRVVWLATGRNFPDALAAGAAVSHLGQYLLLVAPDDLANSPEIGDWLSANEATIERVRFIGGSGAVSDQVFDQVGTLLGALVEPT